MKDDVVLVTGASSGIGAAVARELGKRGARLVLAARRKDALDELVAELASRGATAMAVACDVTKDGDPEAAVASAVGRFGALDTVVANAGFGVAGRFESLTLEDVVRTLLAALPEIRRRRGRIAVVGSVNGYIGTPAASSYCMSKFAVRGLCDCLRLEMAPHGVSVTHIAPGFVASEIRFKDNRGALHAGSKDPVPSWLVASAEDAAEEIATAIERREKERVVTFHGKVAVFLQRHAPWIIDAVVPLVDGDRRPDRGRARKR